MKIKLLLVCCLAASVASCEPFMFSMFPGYLSDAVAVTDMSTLLVGAAIEHFDFCVLNNGAEEYAFITASRFDGGKDLYVLSSDLTTVLKFSHAGLGARHFVGTGGDFVIGQCTIGPGITAASIVNPISNNPMGPDGYGCAIFFSSGLENVFLLADGQYLEGRAFTSGWGLVATQPMSAQLTPDYRMYNLVSCDRLSNIIINGAVTPAISVLGFRERDSWPNPGHAVIYIDGQYSSYDTPPVLYTTPPGRFVMDIGDLRDSNEPVFATRDGVVALGADGTWRLIGWTGQVLASTRDNGAAGDVLIDFAPADYYYVFDPSALLVVKARDWWIHG